MSNALLRPVCWIVGHKIDAKLPTITVTVNPPAEVYRLDWHCQRCGKHGFERYVVSEFGGLYDSEGAV